MISTTDGLIYLTALRSLESIEIQFTPLLNKERVPNYGEIQVVGRNNPFQHYTGGKDTLNLELDFHSDEESREDVVRKVRMLESWSVNDGYDNPPERIRFTFGNFFREGEIWVITQINTDFSLFDNNYGMLPRQAYVQLTLTLDSSTNRRKTDIQWN